jgi:uncharacterized membrane protein
MEIFGALFIIFVVVYLFVLSERIREINEQLKHHSDAITDLYKELETAQKKLKRKK